MAKQRTKTEITTSKYLALENGAEIINFENISRDPSGRNMRQTLAGIILRLLGARVVYEEADLPTSMKREAGSSPSEALFYSADSLSDRPGEGLFDRLVCVLHALLGSCKPSWLKPKLPPSKATVKSPRDFPAFDREAAENLQVSL